MEDINFAVANDTEKIIKDFYNSNCENYNLLIEQLRKTSQLCNIYDKILDHSADGLYITDAKANTLKVNKSYENITGFSREMLKNMNVADLIKKGYVNKSGALLVIENNNQPITFEQRINNGKLVLVTCNPMLGDDGKLLMIITNTRDVTELEELKNLSIKNKEFIEKDQIEIENLKKHLLEDPEIIACDKKLLDLLLAIDRLSETNTTVLLLGETGVGKDEFAKYIYRNSNRKHERFIAINCGAIPDNLVESELFGYEKGSFTSADSRGKIGLFEAANHGTVFLDEIADVPLNIQVKLLRVLQEKQIVRIGSVKPIKIDVRIIAATNKNLWEMVKKGAFREDLYYRLNVLPINIPPLRNRIDDIIPLTEHFLAELNTKYSYNKKLSVDAKNALLSYSWPGNIRELKNVIERAVLLNKNNLIMASELSILPASDISPLDYNDQIDITEVLCRIEYDLLNKAYEKHNNVRDAAKSLGMALSTYVRKRKQYRKKYGV